jgi:hypothetical protein
MTKQSMAWNKAHPEKMREAQKRYLLKHKQSNAHLLSFKLAKRKYNIKLKLLGKFNRGNRKAQSQRSRDKNPLKNRAMNRVCCAVKSGKLIKPETCSVCNTKGYIMGHHEDYNKPLEVIWVCWKCHEGIHAKKETSL